MVCLMNLYATINNILKQKTEGNMWFKASLMPLYLQKTILTFGLKDLLPAFRLLTRRIMILYNSQVKRKNLRFVFTYLKEVFLVYQFNFLGHQYTPKVRVAVDSKGYPKIIPMIIRHSNENRVYSAVLTILGVHRVIPWWPKVDLTSIIAPHSGVSTTLSKSLLLKAKRNLLSLNPNSKYLKLPPIKGLTLMSAGPNGPVSMFSIIEDALAFWFYKGYTWNLIKWYLDHGGAKYALSLILIMILGYPYLFVNGFAKKYNLGKLSTVYDVAGKARVIGITNWWIQIALYPVHKATFSFLKNLPTDGTFNQHRPIRTMIDRGVTENIYSLDLTAATDRLPLDLQEHVLSLFIGESNSSMWRNLISIPFAYDGNLIKYSVGQPMGAYSSWSTMALTHHMIVQASSPTPTSEYAILGDDVVIHGKALSENYLNIMKTLGVEISESKTLISPTHCEFAKKIFDFATGNEISCLGPKLILTTVRTKAFSYMLIIESLNRGLISSMPDVVRMLNLFKIDIGFGLWSICKSIGIDKPYQLAGSFDQVNWLEVLPMSFTASQRYIVYNAISALWLTSQRKATALARESYSSVCVKDFLNPDMRKRLPIQGVLYSPLAYVSPGYWLILAKLSKLIQPKSILKGDGSWEHIMSIKSGLKDIDYYNPSPSIQDLKALDKLYKSFIKEVNLSFNDLRISPYDDFY
jgi:hypothetical protein